MTRRGFLALAATVRDESIARLARRELPAGTEHVLLRTADASIVSSEWRDQRTAAPLGSLVKPFVALAYGAGNASAFPQLECRGCWLPRGHGRMDITAALAQSCNSYFLQLAQLARIDDIERVAELYGLPMPRDTSPESLIGRYGNWRAKPGSIVAAYHELVQRRSDPTVELIFNALRVCARSGTAAGTMARVAAKTGTAPCAHLARSAGDGLLVALFPEQSPEFVLLARAHGVPGAECARRASAFLRAVLT